MWLGPRQHWARWQGDGSKFDWAPPSLPCAVLVAPFTHCTAPARHCSFVVYALTTLPAAFLLPLRSCCSSSRLPTSHTPKSLASISSVKGARSLRHRQRAFRLVLTTASSPLHSVFSSQDTKQQ
ncbi:hypothetical protein CALVIDRAFT_335881 [Calocera viscosa TUFC12733]|uniref:Uncharacterized protein n=1 Tax=Calocera viscosa (strain TUFC12733) TaxID=1330018 RepID=A0A167HNC8_CALVF|nr:hypothetical protein CALVIDRAFT_335881 [Calocera viscosa TUFC12733]